MCDCDDIIGITVPTGDTGATGAQGPQDMGKLMGVLSAKLAGKADGKAIAAMVKEVLAQ